VRGTDIVSSQHTPPDTVPERGQVTDDAPEVASSIPGKESWHVLSEDVCRLNLPHHFGELRPKVTVIGTTFSLSCDGERLARKTPHNHVRNASVLSGVTRSNELPHIPEDGGRIKKAILNPRLEDRLAIRVDFDVADGPESEESVGKDPASCPGEKVQDIHLTSSSRSCSSASPHKRRIFTPAAF